MYQSAPINLSNYDLMYLVKNGETIAIGTEKQCEEYAEKNAIGTYQINYLDEYYGQ